MDKRILSVMLTVLLIFGTVSFVLPVSAEEGTSYQVGDIIEYGTYPQSRVTDEALIAKLDALDKRWVSYKYYVGTGSWKDGNMTQSDYMQYTDFFCDGEKYRAVVFSAYRPLETGYPQTAGKTQQDDNGYIPNIIYYFKYEPLKWRVLDPSSGYILCEDVIDSQCYHNTVFYADKEYWQDKTATVYANDYATSSVRAWLNDDFYETAFTTTQKNNVSLYTWNNDAYSATYEKYNSVSTNDKISMLSWADIKNTDLGLTKASARKANGTEYAKCQGVYTSSNSGFSWYWLRSATKKGYLAGGIFADGSTESEGYVNSNRRGIRPVCYLKTLYSNAEMSNLLFSETKEAAIEIVQASEGVLTLNVPEATQYQTIVVSGVTESEAAVELYIDDVLVSTTQASKVGCYYAELELPSAEIGITYRITAIATVSGNKKSVSETVRFVDKTPELTEFKFYFEYAHSKKQKCIDLMSLNGKRPTTIVNIHAPMRFVIDIANPETVDSVCVTSTKKGVKKSIEAFYDEESGKYIAEGFFDSSNNRYVPGTLNVEYKVKKPSLLYQPGDTVDFSSEILSKNLPSFLQDAEKQIQLTANGIEMLLKLDDSAGEELKNSEIKVIIDQASKAFGDIGEVMQSYENFFSYLIPGVDDEKYVLNLDLTDPKTMVITVNDIVNSKVVNLMLEYHNDPTTFTTLDDVMSVTSSAGTLVGYLASLYSIDSDYDKLVESIYKKYSGDELTQKLKEAEELRERQKQYKTATTLMSLLVLTAGVAVGPEMAAASLLFSALLKSFDIMSVFAWDIQRSKIMNGSVGFNLKFIMDPSGYVYEAVESNRVENVTTTIYYKDDETGEAVKWLANEYDQENPLLTDDAGQYAWDVPEGLWQVKFEKEGYETVFSDWLEVPPPRTEINISLKSTLPPEVKTVFLDDGIITLEFSQYVDVATVTDESITITQSAGDIVNGVWEATNGEINPENEEQTLATTFCFVPETELEGPQNISVYGVRNYRGKLMQSIYQSEIKPINEPHTHDYTATITIPATCTEPGEATYTCSCGDTYTEEIPALGHVDENNDGKCDGCGTQMTGGDHCKFCGKIHNGGFFDKLTGFFHKIFALFKRK